jgi:putative tricarboxylic transport membrane protein
VKLIIVKAISGIREVNLEMKITIKANLTTGIMFGILAVLIWCLIPSQIMTSETTEITAKSVPQLITGIMFLLSMALIVQSLAFKKDKDVDIYLGKEAKMLLFFLMLIVYAILLSIIGFVFSSILFCIGFLLYMKSKNWVFYAVSFAVIVLLKIIFTVVLQVPLP